MLPSAVAGCPNAHGRPKALYEPVHARARLFAGQGKANPIAAILRLCHGAALFLDQGDESRASRKKAVEQGFLADMVRDRQTLMGPRRRLPYLEPRKMGRRHPRALERRGL